MGLFDFLKQKKGAGFDNWHAETDIDKFSGIGQAEIESYVSRIDDEIYEFVILTPPEPVDGCDTFVIYKDGGLKMEFSIKGDHNTNKVYAKSGLTQADAVSIVMDMANKGTIPALDTLEALGTVTDPKKNWLDMKISLHDLN